jgi:hypothetical protein
MSLALEHRFIVGKIPKAVRFLPIVFPICYKRVCLQLLRRRPHELVEQAWQQAGIPDPIRTAVIRATVEEFCWPTASPFLPEDECFVLLHFWHRKWVDNLELVSYILQLERELAIDIPAELLSNLYALRLGEFAKELAGLAGKAPQ